MSEQRTHIVRWAHTALLTCVCALLPLSLLPHASHAQAPVGTSHSQPARVNHRAPIPLANGDEPQACQVGKTQYVPIEPPVFERLGIQQAWELSTGGVLVAVVDSGVSSANEHLKEAVQPGTDFVDSGGDGRTDVDGHGTAVAGQIASRPVEGSGLVGIAKSAQILPVRVYASTRPEDTDNGRGPNVKRTAAGIRWAADHGAKIIAVPASSPSDHAELAQAVAYATNAGALIVASAGNADPNGENSGVRFPANYEQVLSVSAVTLQGQPSDSVVHGVHVEVAAPGSDVLTTFLQWGDCVLSGEQPSTSYSTGYVAGIAALVAAAHPEETPADWKYRILATALRSTPSERNEIVGWGIVAPKDAINFVNDGTQDGPPNPRYQRADRPIPPPVRLVKPEEDLTKSRTQYLTIAAGIGVAVLLGSLVAATLIDQHRQTRKRARKSSVTTRHVSNPFSLRVPRTESGQK